MNDPIWLVKIINGPTVRFMTKPDATALRKLAGQTIKELNDTGLWVNVRGEVVLSVEAPIMFIDGAEFFKELIEE